MRHAERREEISATLLLCCAGAAVLIAAMGITGDWDHVDFGGLVLIALSLALCGGAVWRLRDGEKGRPAAKPRPLYAKKLFIVAVVLHIATAVSMERAVTGADIDTYTFQKEACSRLLHGQDPYGGTQANLYSPADTQRFYGPQVVRGGRVQVGLQYPPLTLLWLLPGFVLGDIRYSFVLAVLLSAWLLYRLYKDERGMWLAFALLANPFTFYVENRCFTEPLVLFTLCLTVYAAVHRRPWLFLALGLFLAAKQYNFLALPLLGSLVRPFSGRRCFMLAAGACAVALATVLPFAIWNWRVLVHDLVWFHIVQPFRQDALSFAVLWPPLVRVGVVLCAALLIWMAFRAPRNAGSFAAGYGMALLLFVATGKQAFANYYFLVANALLLAAAAMPWIPVAAPEINLAVARPREESL